MSDGWEVWRRRSDDQVIAAALRLEDYTDEGRLIIRSEMHRRGLTLPHPAIHVYRVKNPAGGTMDIVSVLPEDIVFSEGSVIESVVGRLRKPADQGGTLTPDNLDANPLFADVLHEVIARYGPDEPDLKEEARRIGSGKVYVIDGRTPQPDGFVPASDIIGTFAVDGGRVVAGSYARNPNHTVLSAMGFFRLSPVLHERLAAELAARNVRRDRGSA